MINCFNRTTKCRKTTTLGHDHKARHRDLGFNQKRDTIQTLSSERMLQVYRSPYWSLKCHAW